MYNEEQSTTQADRLSLSAGAVLTALIRRTVPSSEYIVMSFEEIAQLAHGDPNADCDDEVLTAIEELERNKFITIFPFDNPAYQIYINPPMDAAEDDHSWRSATRVAELVSGAEMLVHFAGELGPDAVLMGLYALTEGTGRSEPVPVPSRSTGEILGMRHERLLRAKHRLTTEGDVAFKLIPAHRPAGRPDAIKLKRRILDDLEGFEEALDFAESAVKAAGEQEVTA